jgi:hypothetical protein
MTNDDTPLGRGEKRGLFWTPPARGLPMKVLFDERINLGLSPEAMESTGVIDELG